MSLNPEQSLYWFSLTVTVFYLEYIGQWCRFESSSPVVFQRTEWELSEWYSSARWRRGWGGRFWKSRLKSNHHFIIHWRNTCMRKHVNTNLCWRSQCLQLLRSQVYTEHWRTTSMEAHRHSLTLSTLGSLPAACSKRVSIMTTVIG